jgi:hypothetical protein
MCDVLTGATTRRREQEVPKIARARLERLAISRESAGIHLQLTGCLPAMRRDTGLSQTEAEETYSACDQPAADPVYTSVLTGHGWRVRGHNEVRSDEEDNGESSEQVEEV